MAIFGFIVLLLIAVVLTIVIIFAIKFGGEEFSTAGLVPSVIGILIIIAMWYALILHAPFKVVAA